MSKNQAILDSFDFFSQETKDSLDYECKKHGC